MEKLSLIANVIISIYFFLLILSVINDIISFKFKKNLETKKIDYINYDILKKFKKGEYIPLEEVLMDFSWHDIWIAKKEQNPNIEICYLVRKKETITFKILSSEELSELEKIETLNNYFISPLFKIRD